MFYIYVLKNYCWTMSLGSVWIPPADGVQQWVSWLIGLGSELVSPDYSWLHSCRTLHLQLQWLRETTSYLLHLQVSQPHESHSLSDASIVSLTSLSCTLYLLPPLVNWFGRRALPFLSWPRPWDNARFSILAAIKMPERFVVRRFLMG